MAEQATFLSHPPITVPALGSFWTPVRNLLISISLTAVAFTVFGYFWKEKGFELLVIGMGWPHVILGFLFYLGRVLRNESGARIGIMVLASLTLFFGTLHYWLDLTFFIFIFFFFHAFRDEIAIQLQLRDRTKSPLSVYALKGFIPITLLVLCMFQPQDFRQVARNVNIQSSQMNLNGWTLIPFDPVQASAGKNWHFNIQAPESKGYSGYVTSTVTEEQFPNGELRIGDRRTDYARDLLFVPKYGSDIIVPPEPFAAASTTKDIEMAGKNRIGQTFTAERDELSGIWIRTLFPSATAPDLHFIFKLDSPPLFPLEFPWTLVKTIIMVLLGLWFLLMVVRSGRSDLGVWAYAGLFALLFLVYQQVVRPASNVAYLFPNGISVVVFHYFSWYVFSYTKFFKSRAAASPTTAIQTPVVSGYDRFLGRLRNPIYFTLLMIGLNIVSFACVFWYQLGNGPGLLEYGFKGHYFLYILLFHVTFSVNPKSIVNWIQPKLSAA